MFPRLSSKGNQGLEESNVIHYISKRTDSSDVLSKHLAIFGEMFGSNKYELRKCFTKLEEKASRKDIFRDRITKLRVDQHPRNWLMEHRL